MAKVRVFQDAKQRVKLGARRCPWSVEWRENGKRKSKTLGTKDDANDYAAIKRAEIVARKKGISTDKKWTEFVEEYVKRELEASGKRPATIALCRAILDKFTEIISPEWVSLIDEAALDTYRSERLRQDSQKGGKVTAATCKKELRHIHAALGVAKRWRYIAEVPELPRIASDEPEKAHISEEQFKALMEAADAATLPAPELHQCLPEGATAGDWWRALLATLWVTGARIDSVLRLRWEDLDRDTGRILARASILKQRKPSRPEIAKALPYLDKIQGSDPRLLPWNHHKRTLWVQFEKIQKAAGVVAPCPRQGEKGHECRESCHVFGFHAIRYSHARFNFDNPELQNQMGHATAVMTEHYRKWGERRAAQYNAHFPAGLTPEAGSGKEVAQQRENGESESGKPVFRIVSA